MAKKAKPQNIYEATFSNGRVETCQSSKPFKWAWAATDINKTLISWGFSQTAKGAKVNGAKALNAWKNNEIKKTTKAFGADTPLPEVMKAIRAVVTETEKGAVEVVETRIVHWGR